MEGELFRQATLARAHIDLFLMYGQREDLMRAVEELRRALGEEGQR